MRVNIDRQTLISLVNEGAQFARQVEQGVRSRIDGARKGTASRLLARRSRRSVRPIEEEVVPILWVANAGTAVAWSAPGYASPGVLERVATTRGQPGLLFAV